MATGPKLAALNAGAQRGRQFALGFMHQRALAQQQIRAQQAQQQPAPPQTPQATGQGPALKPDSHWPGANMGPELQRTIAPGATPPGRQDALQSMQHKMSATVGSQGPSALDLAYAKKVSGKLRKQGFKNFDPAAFTKRPTPSGGTQYVFVGPDGMTHTTPHAA